MSPPQRVPAGTMTPGQSLSNQFARLCATRKVALCAWKSNSALCNTRCRFLYCIV